MGSTESLVFAVISFFIAVLLVRWIFGINQILKTHKATIGLLILIAKKHGASSDEVDAILDKVYPQKR